MKGVRFESPARLALPQIPLQRHPRTSGGQHIAPAGNLPAGSGVLPRMLQLFFCSPHFLTGILFSSADDLFILYMSRCTGSGGSLFCILCQAPRRKFQISEKKSLRPTIQLLSGSVTVTSSSV